MGRTEDQEGPQRCSSKQVGEHSSKLQLKTRTTCTKICLQLGRGQCTGSSQQLTADDKHEVFREKV